MKAFAARMPIFLALAIVVLPVASNANIKSIPIPRPRPSQLVSSHAITAAIASKPVIAVAGAAAADIALVKQGLDFIRRGKSDQASGLQASIHDPVARKVIEWAVLRSDDTLAGFDRYVAFMTANPSWPSFTVLRRRAESTLWEERRDPATVRAFFATSKPVTAKGRLALARALLAEGERTNGVSYLRA